MLCLQSAVTHHLKTVHYVCLQLLCRLFILFIFKKSEDISYSFHLSRRLQLLTTAVCDVYFNKDKYELDNSL